MPTIKPLRNRVVIKKDPVKETTAGGIVLPSCYTDALKDTQTQGTVMAVGPGITNQDGSFTPTSLKAGDKVLIPKYTAMSIQDMDKDILIIPECDILSVIEYE